MHVTKVVYIVRRIPEQLSLYFSDFSTNLYRFYKFAVFGNKKKNKTDSRIYTPGKFWGLAQQSLAGVQGRGSLCRADFGEGEARRRRGRGGEARGGRVLPRCGLGRGWGGRRGVVAGAVDAAVAVSSDGGTPAADSRWARAGEVHRREEELAGGRSGRWKTRGVSSTTAMEGRR